jgi:hypothetical protein
MALTKVKLIADGVITSANLDASHGITTSDIGEGSNLYYTDARVSSYLSTNGFATQTDIVAAITDSAPATLDTLNELAAALGDDANFSTTVTNSIALKAPLASPSFTGNATFAGDVNIGNNDSTATRQLTIGQGRTGNGFSFIDLVGDATYTDYGFRMLRGNGGANSLSILEHRGTGNLEIKTAEAAPIVFETSGSERMRIDSSGNTTFSGSSGAISGTGSVYINNGDDAFALVINNAGTSSQNDRGVFDARVGGGSVLRINNSGNVGIKTDSPSATLDVHSPSTTAPSLTMGAAAGQIFKNEDLEFAFGLNNASPYNGWIQARFTGDNSRSIAINPLGGSVGIGTNSPEQKLHVEGASITVNRGNDDSSIAFQNSTSGATWRIGRDYSNSEALTFAYSATDYPSLTGNGLIYINTSGNVGIGTDTPSALLEIQTAGTSGNQDFQIFSRGESPNYEVFKISRSAGSAELLANQNLTLSADYDANHTSVDSNIKFKTDNTERMRIDSSGFVTIKNTPNTTGASLTLQNQTEISVNETIGYLNFSSTDTSTSSSGGVGGIGVYGEETFNTSYTPTYMSFYTHERTTNDGTVRGNVTERMRIDSSGTVQVRNTTPTIQLYNTDNGLANNQTLGDIDWYQIDPSDQGVGTVAKIRAINTSTFSGSADLTFQTGNATSITERMRITSLGNVGIGTTNTYDSSWGVNSKQVTIQGADYGVLRLENDAQTTRYAIGAGDGNLYLAYDDVASEHRILVDSSGNVGIGTTSPTNLLTINDPNANSSITDTIPSWWGLVIDRAYSTSSSAAMALIGGTVATGSSGRLYLGNSDDVDNTYIDGGANQLHFSVGGSERMRILSSGGITFNGDTSTANALDDYEEGTFSTNPVSTNVTNYSFSGPNGRYTKIGRQVIATFVITNIDAGTGNRYFVISQLPFAQHTANHNETGYCSNYPDGQRRSGIVVNASSSNTSQWYVSWYNNSAQSGDSIRATIIYTTT